MQRGFLRCTLGFLASFCALPDSAAAKDMLVVADPQDSSAGVQLLEHAIVDELQKNPGYQALAFDSALVRLAKGQSKELAQIDETLRAARAQFDNLEPDAALKQYTRVLAKLDKAVINNENLRHLTDTLAMVSAIHLLLGQEKKARATLERLLVVNDLYVPDETIFNPQMMGVFASVSAKIKGSPGFDCEIATEPAGAAVFFDGRLVGLSPVIVKGARKGKHLVGAAFRGYERVVKRIDVKPKGPRNVLLKLSPMIKRDAGTVDLAIGALEGIDESGTPPEAKELLTLTRTDMILLLQVSPSTSTLAVFSEGGERVTRTAKGEPIDLETAQRMARELLGSLASSPPVPEESKPATVAAEDDKEDLDDKSKSESKPDDQPKIDELPNRVASAPLAPASGSNKVMVLVGLYGGAALLAAGGGVFGTLALLNQSEFERTTTSGGKVIQERTTDQIEGKSVASSGRRNALIADILYGTAVAAAVTGVIVHLVWNPQPATTTVSSGGQSGWSFAISPGYGSFSVQF